ncbi:MAG: hypothetical protein RJA10_3770 [Pseudomonadota bacterium]|jgi:hypothetical protein
MNTSLALAANAAALPDAPRLQRPALLHCLLLATLLHLWLVVLVGTTPGGVALPGEDVWSTIQVRLSGTGPTDSPGQADTPRLPSGPAGAAPEPRYGGTVRDAPSRPSPEPGAAELGVWAPRPLPGPAGSPPAPPSLPDPSPMPVPPPPVLSRPSPAAPALERRADGPVAPAPLSNLPDPPLRTAPAAAPSTAPRLSPVDTLEAPALDRAEQLQRDIATPATTPAPVLRPLPAPAPQREERAPLPPAPLPAAPPPRAGLLPLPDAAAPLQAPVPAPSPIAIGSPPVAAAEPARPTPATEAAPAPAAAAPALPALPLEPRSAPRLSPITPLDVGAAARQAAPELTVPQVRLADAPSPAPAAVPGPVSPARDSLLPVAPAPLAGAGRPAAGPSASTDRATPPSPAASAAALNLELPRARAPLPGLATPRVLNLVPPPPERKSALTEGIEKSAKPDCRKAYSGMGVLGVVPLAADAMRDGGCKW